MYIMLINRSRQTIQYTTDNKTKELIGPGARKAVNCPESGLLRIRVQNARPSRTRKPGWLEDLIYELVFISDYRVSGLEDGDIVCLTRERIRVSKFAAYDRIFLQAAATATVAEQHRIASLARMKAVYWRERLIFGLFRFTADLMVYTTWGSWLLSIGVGLVFGWKIAGDYFLAITAIIIVGIVFEELLDRVFEGRQYKQSNVRVNMRQTFIAKYYSAPQRIPYEGEIENS